MRCLGCDVSSLVANFSPSLTPADVLLRPGPTPSFVALTPQVMCDSGPWLGVSFLWLP